MAEASCTILTTSSSLSLARGLITRVVEEATGAPAIHGGDPDRVPWLIDNKYYTAQVHFSIHTARDVDAAEPGPPALLYVFPKGKAFREEFVRVQAAVADHDFEVTLAASVSAGFPGTHEDEDEAEQFFREHGVEFIDGDAHAHAHEDGDDDRDAGGVHRIIDALSTIIWPSMTRKDAQRASRIAGGPHIMLNSRLSGGGEEDALLSFLGATGSAPRTQAEDVAALERWLEEDEDTEHMQSPLSAGEESLLVLPHASWTHFPSGSSTSLHKLTPEHTSSSFPLASGHQIEHSTTGFEDDFSDFVTAPTSDTVGYDALIDSDDDDALPSHDEIFAASTRIFGPGGRAHSDQDAVDGGAAQAPDASSAEFDLTHAFSALQAMRDEISAISDDAERRRAAARVALGFAYGLDLGSATTEEKRTI